MSKAFYNGPKIEIGKEYVKIKTKKIQLGYDEIKLVSIKNTRLDRRWLLYIIGGIILFGIILYLFILVFISLLNGSSILTGNGHSYKNRFLTVLVFFFIGGPLFIISKIKKYFRKYLMLVIKWGNHDFRIRVSKLKINERDLGKFFEGKVKNLETEF